MRLLIAAIGRLKDGAERDLYQRYAERLQAFARQVAIGPLELVELPESKAARAEDRKVDEAQRLLKIVANSDYIVCLDEGGRTTSSAAFASLLTLQRDRGCSTAAFLIGGPDGHGEMVSTRAHHKLSLSPMTLPHGLARVVLAEQLYRAATIASGHPYHRA